MAGSERCRDTARPGVASRPRCVLPPPHRADLADHGQRDLLGPWRGSAILFPIRSRILAVFAGRCDPYRVRRWMDPACTAALETRKARASGTKCAPGGWRVNSSPSPKGGSAGRCGDRYIITSLRSQRRLSPCGSTHGQINGVPLLFARLSQDPIRTRYWVGMVERHSIEDAHDHLARERVFVRQSA